MRNIKKGIIVSLIAITALIKNTNVVNAQSFEIKEEIKYSMKQHSNIIDDIGIKKDIDEIVSKIHKFKNQNNIETLIEQEEKAKLSNKDIAKMVINGEYSNGKERKQKLKEEGRDFNEIQKEVEKILKKEIEEKNNLTNIKTKINAKKSTKKSTLNNKIEDSISTNKILGKTMTMVATGYSTAQPGLSRYTANGTDLHKNPNVISVDPKVIPLGTKVTIEGYGSYIAADTGGDYKGNRIDIHFNTIEKCQNFRNRNVKITIHN